MTVAILYTPSTPDLYPRSVADFRAAFPDLAVGDNPRDEDVAPYGWRVVAPTAPPVAGPGQRVEEIQPVETGGQWRQAWRLVDLPPQPPEPDWIGFDIALQGEPLIVATINDLGRLSQVAALSLGHALQEVEDGHLDRFTPIWTEWLIATNPPADTLDRFRALAAAHHLPADFQAAIAAAPAGPPVAP
jgi:hypothetical protein